MNSLVIEKTDSTPHIILDCEKNFIEFTGDSRPENVKLFFEPVLNWISEYANYVYFISKQSNSIIKIEVNFKLEYFNSSSAKYIIDILRAINKINADHNPKINLVINWCYSPEDDDMLLAGEEYVKITGINMNFVTY